MADKQFTTVSDFRYELLQLNEALKDFHSFLMDECVCQMARVYALPVIEQPQANERHVALMRLRQEADIDSLSVPLNEPFAVSEQSGFTAFTQSMAHFQKMYASDGESTRYSKRLPGLLCLNTDDPDTLLKLVSNINTQKDVLASTIKGLADDVNMRFELVHNAEPGFMQTMATRHITAIAGSQLLSVSFQWEHKNVIKRMSKKAVLEKIERSLEYGKNQRSTYETQEGFELFVEKERETIQSYPNDAEFKIERYDYYPNSYPLIFSNIIIENGEIASIGMGSSANSINCEGKMVTCGFIDSHTHPVFYNNRDNEYAMRLSGSTYEDASMITSNKFVFGSPSC